MINENKKLSQSNLNKIDNLKDFEKIYGSELEGTINNEPLKNIYKTIKYHKMNKFPYFFIGKIVSKFTYNNSKHFINGVGILIGPKIILTVAHNLCHLNSSNKKNILIAKKVNFYPASNADFTPFFNINSNQIYISPNYLEALIMNDKNKQLENDWSLIFLKENLGQSILNLFDINLNNNENNFLQIENNLYKFFLNEINLNDLNNYQMSLIGYTEYKNNYNNSNIYKFFNNFINENNILNNNNNNEEINFNKISNEITTFEENQGKIIEEFLDEEKQLILNNKKKSNNLINNNNNKTNNNLNINNINIIEEGLFISNKNNNFFSEKKNENGLNYIILNNKNENRNFNTFEDINKLIMSESIGNFEIKNYYIFYKISTYKGQSGSPIFLIKKDEKRDEYDYYFIGIHSRRGPSRGELLLNKKKKDKLKEDYFDNLSNKNWNKYQNYYNYDENVNGLCEYNFALGIFGNKKKEIINIINYTHKKLNNNKLIFDNYYLNENDNNNNINTPFILIKLLLYEELKFIGIFNKNLSYEILFNFAGKILKIPEQFILLQIENDEDIILNYNYDKSKKIFTIFNEIKINNIKNNNKNIKKLIFIIKINMKKYGEFLAEKILNKYLIDKNTNINLIKNNINEHKKEIFNSIFFEIKNFINYSFLYGNIFKKIRKVILTKLDIIEKK